MSKTEEIREVLNAWRDDRCLYLSEDKPCLQNALGNGYCSSDKVSYQCLTKRLSDLGVVIKVDRRPPHRVTEVTADTEAEKRGYNQAEADMLEAGYVALESLIEEVKVGNT